MKGGPIRRAKSPPGGSILMTSAPAIAELHRAERTAESLRKIEDAKAGETSRITHFETPAPRSSMMPSSASSSTACSPGLPPARIGPAGVRSNFHGKPSTCIRPQCGVSISTM